MTVDTIIEQAGIPLLLLVICVYYAIRLIVLHDSQAIRGKNKPPVKDERTARREESCCCSSVRLPF